MKTQKMLTRFLVLPALFLVFLCGCISQQPTSVPVTEVTTTATTTGTTTEATTQPTETTTALTESVPTEVTTTSPTAKKTTTTTKMVITTADWVKNYDAMQILHDPDFKNGFGVVKQETTQVFGVWDYGQNKNDYVWTTAQWGLFKSYTDKSAYINFLTDRIKTAENILQSQYERMEYNKGTLTMSVNTFDFFGGKGHTDNSSWPHLLIGQKMFDRMDFYTLEDEETRFYSCGADKIIVGVDLRMTNYRHEEYEGINACQFISFYNIGSRRDVNTGGIWFGLPYFDSRGYSGTEKSYFMMDNGTGMYMYHIPPVDLYDSTSLDGRYDFFGDDGKPLANDDWLHLEIDIKPYIEKMAKQAMKGTEYNVFQKTTNISDLYFKEMNIGFEIHGSYDVTFEIRNFSLTSYYKK